MSDNSDTPEKPRSTRRPSRRKAAHLKLVSLEGRAVAKAKAKPDPQEPQPEYPKGMTYKQEMFCRGVADGLTQTEAYKRAGYSQAQTDKSIHENASRLMADAKIQSRIKALAKARDEVKQHDPREVRAEVLQTLRSILADPQARHADRMKAAELLGRWGEVSLFNDVSTVKVESTSPEDAMAQLREKLAKLKAS